MSLTASTQIPDSQTFRELKSIFRAIKIESATSFSVSTGEGDVALRVNGDSLIKGLKDWLYTSCFARGFGSRTSVIQEPHTEEVLGNLAAANHGRDQWISGWRIMRVRRDGGIEAVKGSARLVAAASDYSMTFSGELRPRAGCDATIRHRIESRRLQTGVYYAFGEALPEADDEREVVRLYINVGGAAAAPIFEVITGNFNAQRRPFTLKTMIEPRDQDRRDATVLYLPKRAFESFTSLLPSLPKILRPEEPLFTKRLAEGIGLAENPGNGESFGINRCRLVAEAIVDAWTKGAQDVESRLESLDRCFAIDGLSLNASYLNSGSEDIYTFTCQSSDAEPERETC